MSIRKPSKRYREIAALYRRFAKDWEDCCDFSEQSLMDMYISESLGSIRLEMTKNSEGKYNGYFVGKKWLDVMLATWAEDIRDGILFKSEILEEYDDPIITNFLNGTKQGRFDLS